MAAGWESRCEHTSFKLLTMLPRSCYSERDLHERILRTHRRSMQLHSRAAPHHSAFALERRHFIWQMTGSDACLRSGARSCSYPSYPWAVNGPPPLEQDLHRRRKSNPPKIAGVCIQPAPLATTTVMLELVTRERTAASRVWLYAPAGMPRLSVTTAGFTAF